LGSIICFANVPTTEVSRDKVLSRPEWREKYDAYTPDSTQIAVLKSKLGEDLRINIYLGFWCPDSQNNVPPFLKILDSAGIAVPVRFFNVQRKPVKSIRYFVDQLQVERVPTFIFYRGDKEIGRIIENPMKGLAEDLIEILSKE
jgi:hypothetical protein